MTEWMANVDVLGGDAAQGMEQCVRRLRQVCSQVRAEAYSLRIRGGSQYALRRKLLNVCDQISGEASAGQRLSKALSGAARWYGSTENRLARGGRAPAWRKTGAGGVAGQGMDTGWDTGLLTGYEKEFVLGEVGVEGAAVSGGVAFSGTVLGMDASLNASGSLAGGYANGKLTVDREDLGVKVSGKTSSWLAQGSLEATLGSAAWGMSGSVGEVSATGEIGASLFQDGKFAPTVYGSAKAEVSAAKGEMHYQNGTENFNQHLSASGTLLGAEAEASGTIGMITRTDENGVETTEFGAEGKVGAEAYLAEGKVSGGFTLFGIKFDLELSGKAGGAGVEAGGQVTTGGASGEIGAGLGLGIGLKFSIDWSKFSLW